jgi:hypothetical protein
MNQIVVLIIIVVFVCIFFNFSEGLDSQVGYSGTPQDNAFTSLTCLPTSTGDHVVKVAPSANDPSKMTIQSLLNPTNNYNIVQKQDIIPDPNVPCDDVKFSAAYVKQLRDINSPARKLFNAINSGSIVPDKNSFGSSTWKTLECKSNNLNDPSHWCNTVFNHLITNRATLCDSSIGHIPASFCTKLDQLSAYTSSNDPVTGPVTNDFGTVKGTPGANVMTRCTHNANIHKKALYPMGFNDEYGNPLFTFSGTNFNSNKKRANCKGRGCGSAVRDPTTTEIDNLKQTNWYLNNQVCLGSGEYPPGYD